MRAVRGTGAVSPARGRLERATWSRYFRQYVWEQLQQLEHVDRAGLRAFLESGGADALYLTRPAAPAAAGDAAALAAGETAAAPLARSHGAASSRRDVASEGQRRRQRDLLEVVAARLEQLVAPGDAQEPLPASPDDSDAEAESDADAAPGRRRPRAAAAEEHARRTHFATTTLAGAKRAADAALAAKLRANCSFWKAVRLLGRGKQPPAILTLLETLKLKARAACDTAVDSGVEAWFGDVLRSWQEPAAAEALGGRAAPLSSLDDAQKTAFWNAVAEASKTSKSLAVPQIAAATSRKVWEALRERLGDLAAEVRLQAAERADRARPARELSASSSGRRSAPGPAAAPGSAQGPAEAVLHRLSRLEAQEAEPPAAQAGGQDPGQPPQLRHLTALLARLDALLSAAELDFVSGAALLEDLERAWAAVELPPWPQVFAAAYDRRERRPADPLAEVRAPVPRPVARPPEPPASRTRDELFWEHLQRNIATRLQRLKQWDRVRELVVRHIRQHGQPERELARFSETFAAARRADDVRRLEGGWDAAWGDFPTVIREALREAQATASEASQSEEHVAKLLAAASSQGHDLNKLRALWDPAWGDFGALVELTGQALPAAPPAAGPATGAAPCEALAFRRGVMVPCRRAVPAGQAFCPAHGHPQWRALAGTAAHPATPWDDVRLLRAVQPRETFEVAAVHELLAHHGAELGDLHFYDAQDLNGLAAGGIDALAREQRVLSAQALAALQSLPDVKRKKAYFVRQQDAAALALGFVAAHAPDWAAEWLASQGRGPSGRALSGR